MRILATLAVLAVALWSGYWALGARGLETGLSAWLEARRAEGWAADVATVGVTGFPMRFETALDDLSLADPGTGLAWSAPAFRIEAEAYRPHHVTLTWPQTQTLATPTETIAIGAQRMEGRLAFRPGPALEVAGADYVLEAFSLASSLGWEATMARAELNSAAVEGRKNAHAVAFAADRMHPPARLVALLGRTGVLPALFDHVRIDGILGFDAPWDRHAIEDRRPQITRIELAELDAKWGDLELRAAGDLDVDSEGRPSGALTVRATNWREMVEIARASGRVPPALADRIEDALELLAGLGGRPETLDVTLRFAGGQTWFGPVPIAPAPDFTIR
ncbi:MAG: DUF2125 domain-containing protein [Rhodovulum sp.]